MKKLKTILNYFIWIPFAVSIGSFVLYFRYYFTLKIAPNTVITSAVSAVMERYLKIGLFSLFVGLLLLFIKKISRLIFNEDKYYNEKYPWTNNIKEKNTKNEEIRKINEEFLNEIKQETKENETEEKVNIVSENKNDDFIINDSLQPGNKIVEDLNKNKVLKARFINNDNEEKMIEILTDEDEETEVLSLKDVVVMPEVKKQTIIKVDSSKVKIDGFKHCKKCHNLVVEDAAICVHCGVLIDESLRGKITDDYKIKQQSKKFNGTKFAINLIIIILCFLCIILLCNKIGSQKTTNDENINNKSNMNIKNIIK